MILKKTCTTIRDAFSIIVFPEKAYQNIREKTEWAGILLFVGVFITISGFVNRLVVQISLKNILSKELIVSATKSFNDHQLFIYFFNFSRYLIEILLFSFLCWMMIKILFLNVPFKKVWAIILHCQIIMLFENILLTVILILRSRNILYMLNEASLNIGLGYFFKKSDKTIYLLLNSINVVSIWWLVILTNGIIAVSGISKKNNFLLGIIIFILFLFVRLYMSYFSAQISVNLFN